MSPGRHTSVTTATGGRVIVAGRALVEQPHEESVPRPLVSVKAFARLHAV